MLNKNVIRAISAVSAAIALFLAAGCEDNATPDNYNAAAPVSALSIAPASMELGLGITVASFTASGGTPPYKWSISDSSLGSIPSTGAGTITYTRTGTKLGVNVITVIDQNNWSAQALVSQTAASNTVSEI